MKEKETNINEDIEQLDLDVEIKELEEELKQVEKEIERKYSEVSKKLEEYVERYLASAGMNKILLLDFVLPSADLKSKVIKIEEGGKVITRRRGLDPKDIKAIPSLRTQFYQTLRKHGAFKIGEKGWAILPGFEKQLVKEANKRLMKLNKIITKYGFSPRTLNLIEMYAPTKWVKEKIEETITKYKHDLEKVLEELKQEELKKEKKRRLVSKASKLRRVLQNLERQLVELKRIEEERARKYINVELTKESNIKAEKKSKEPLGSLEEPEEPTIENNVELKEKRKKRRKQYLNI